MKKLEIRSLQQPAQVREGTDTSSNGLTLFGYCAKFGVESQDLGGFTEILMPSCFDQTLSDPNNDVRALFNHDRGRPLGRLGNGSLKLTVDDIGLYYELLMPDTQANRDLAAEIKAGVYPGGSFGFNIVQDHFEPRNGTVPLHVVESVELGEVTPCTTWPAYTQTVVDVRSLKFNEEKQAEKLNHHRNFTFWLNQSWIKSNS